MINVQPDHKQGLTFRLETFLNSTNTNIKSFKALKSEKSLKLKGHNIWAIGDNSGIFRGIVPAMLSGFAIANDFL